MNNLESIAKLEKIEIYHDPKSPAKGESILPPEDKVTHWNTVYKWIITPIAFSLLPVIAVALLIAVAWQKVVHGHSFQTFLARNLVLPGLALSKEMLIEKQKLIPLHRDSLHKFLTADRELIEGVKFQSDQNKQLPSEKQKWIIYCNGNNGSIETNFLDMLNMSTDSGASVISVNYRGVGGSTGVCNSSKAIVEDTDTAMRALIADGVTEENVLFYGYSMGGGASAAVAKNYPKASIVNDRSYESVSAAARAFIWIPFLQELVAWAVAQWCQLNSLVNVQQVEGMKRIIVAPQDFIIGFNEASLYQAFIRERVNNLPQTHLLKYEINTSRSFLERVQGYAENALLSCAAKRI